MSLKNFIESSSQNLSIKAESVAPATSYITNGFVFTWGAMTFNQIMMLVATIFGVATYFTNLYYKRQQNKRELEQERRAEELHQKMMQRKHESADG